MPDGRVVPFCAYNVLPGLYRDAVQSTHSVPVEEWLGRDYATVVDADADGMTRLRSETVTAREVDQEFLREGPGVYGYDVKKHRVIDDDERERIHHEYRRAVERLDPV